MAPASVGPVASLHPIVYILGKHAQGYAARACGPVIAVVCPDGTPDEAERSTRDDDACARRTR